MPSAISSTQIQQLIDTVNAGNYTAVYNFLSGQGYAYADWANGVAQGNSIAGVSALEFLEGTAMLGVGGSVGQTLSSETIESVRQGMALEYLNVLARQAATNGGMTANDIKAPDVWQIHKDVFEKNQLSIENWTLNAPFKIYQQLYGDQVLEDFWTQLRDTGGTGTDAMAANVTVLVKMYEFSKSSDPEIRTQAEAWRAFVPSHVSLDDIKKLGMMLIDLGTTIGSNLPDFLQYIGTSVLDVLIPAAHGADITPTVTNQFTAAQTYVAPPPPRRRDPLVLDLDGNGIQTSGINTVSPILFDHNADGVKTATGWVNANDGFLVWDKNGNGTIDSGRELFGDSTFKSDGSLATNGFNALADLDANHDGVVNGQDSDFANLKVWRDLNQDGVSQSNELFSLDTYQIAGINLANTIVNTAQGNGNTLNETGSYILGDGTTRLVGDINLANNSFYSQFTDTLPLSAEIQALPNIKGVGMVRELRDAASRSPQLAATLSQYTAVTSDLQKAMLDTLFSQWLATSTFTTTADRMGILTDGISHTVITIEGIDAGTPAYTAFMDKLSLVEKFNGRTFHSLPTDPSATLNYTILSAQQALVDQSYQALKNSVYDNLLIQTRLKPYLDALTLDIDNTGIIVDASGIDSVLDTLSLTDAKGALLDLLEFDRIQGQKLKSMGWTGVDTDRLTAYAGKVSLDTQSQTVLSDWHIRIGSGTLTAVAGDAYIFGQGGDDVLDGSNSSNAVMSGGAGNDIINASAGSDTIYGGSGDDTITDPGGTNTIYADDGNDTVSVNGNSTVYAGNGNDTVTASGNNTIYGGDGNDSVTIHYVGANVLDGGAGNDLLKVTHNAATGYDAGFYNESTLFIGGTGDDRLEGSSGADTYQFSRGDGMDSILDIGSNAYGGWGVYVKADAIQFGAGIATSDLRASRSGNNLVLKINDSANPAATDQITVENWFASSIYQIESFVFTDRTTLTNTQLSQMVGTTGNDTIIGTAYGDNLNGFGGNDVLNGNAGNDILDGDVGNDTYIFERGYGADIVHDYDTAAGNTDVLNFGSDIASSQLWFRQVNNDLEVSVIGSTDKATITNWYSGSAYHVEQFKTGDGKLLTDANVDALVQAMAAFAPPSAGQTALPQDYQTALAPVLAANWQ